ncbi:flagellar basal body-associated FliL family protein [Aliamphritea hakodatensis]|uniref:flagellar basal body-associated FliL family protein n=1 Tax=Aliamphritea hakodatensis TaxID=2895352 RepID=UPI0022FD6DF0|nr:flagellar basal body-associated FliL family protein [Aliamphritea hakodatensis]
MMACFVTPVWAADEEEAVPEDYINYIEMKPFIANFSSTGKLRFLKCQVTVQVATPAAHHAVNYYKPEIRHEVLMILSDKQESQLKSVEAQDALAKDLLAAVQKVLLAEEGEAFVSDLFFTSFVIQ